MDHAAIAQEHIHGLSFVTSLSVAPDGGAIASVVGTADVDENTTRTRVWLDGAPITAGPHDGNPTWSPDGRHLAFTSRRGEKKGDSTLHVMPITGPGEVRTVCTRADGLGDVAWSPDGRLIGFTSRTPDERYEAKDVSWQAPRKVERFFSRLNGEDWVFDRPNHVYVVAADGTGKARNLTPGEHQHSGVTWLPDSSGIVTCAARHDSWDRDLANDVYVVPLEGEPRCLTNQAGNYHSASVSPDGAHVAYIGDDFPLVYPQNSRVRVVGIDGTGARSITDMLDRTFMCTVGFGAPVWLDDATLLAQAEDRGETHLYTLTIDGSAPSPITKGSISVHAFDAAGDTVAWLQSDVTRLPEIHTLADGQISSVTKEFRGWEKFAAPCADGTDEIDAWIMRPPDFDPDATYPVMLNVHGGPFTQYGETLFDEAQIQSAAGFVVLMSNPRGGSGRHTSWGQAILGTKHPVVAGSGWGSVDVDDVMAVLDTALDRYPFCDPDRVGMIGGSYGGYMATELAGRYGDRFKAICSERAVNNLLTEEWSSDIGTAFRSEHGPDPVEDPDEYRRMSPIRHADDIHVPMLLIHSEEDWRCPINQAEELWITLRLLGRDVTFYRFPGENHELSRTGSPVHRKMRAEIILDYFADKLGRDPA